MFLSLIQGNQITTNATSKIETNTNNNESGYKHKNAGSLVESIIKKNSFSSTKRLLMFAGLEGVGHHAVTNMFDVCINITNNINNNSNNNIVINGKCIPVPELTSALMFKNASKISGLFFSSDALRAGLHLRNIKNLMTSIYKKKEDNTSSSLYIIGNDHPTTSGMLSYPNYGDPHKALNHPDVSVIARLAELVGLDFRIIVLQRSADEILTSTTKNRRFGGPKEGRILSDNAASLYAQLKLLDSKFFHCLNYHDLNSLSDNKSRDFIEFTHPFIKSLLPKMLETVHTKSQVRNSSDFIDKINNRNISDLGSMTEIKQYLIRNYDLHSIAVRLDLINSICPNQY